MANYPRESGPADPRSSSTGWFVAGGAVLVILGLVFFPVLSPGGRYASRKAVSISNMKQLMLSMIIYCDGNDDKYPVVSKTSDLSSVLEGWEKIHLNGPEKLKGTLEFQFNLHLSGTKVPPENGAELIPVFFEGQPWEDERRTVGYADGHVRRINQDEWRKLDAEFLLKQGASP